MNPLVQPTQRKILTTFLSCLLLWMGYSLVWAQQLDMDILPPSLKSAPSAPSGNTIPTMTKPLSATVTKTLYLPPEMYGQWSITGVLTETNAQPLFRPVVNDIWLLERVGDKVMISNPANGASATVNVDRVEGNQVTFHRGGQVGKNRFMQEIPTISVTGDVLTGRSINKIQQMKDGRLSREYYAVYSLNATRIGTARTMFKPEEALTGPDIEIEDIQR